MIEKMAEIQNLKTGKTVWHVFYENGRVRTFKEKDNWPDTVAEFYTSERTHIVSDNVIQNTRYMRFEQ